jgi:hypothetical protein
MRIAKSLTIGSLLASGFLLAACGAGPGTPSAGTSSAGTSSAGTATAESSASPDGTVAAVTACYRTHGDPGFPDPVYDPGDGRWHFGTSPGSAPLATQQACRHLLPVATPSPPIPQAQFQSLVQLAECLRAHGVLDWPDPDPDGSFGLPPSVQPKSLAFQRASAACQRYMPSGGLNVHAIA